MPKDILDIVDTAIKIGLGAAIGGLSSYFIAGRSHKNEINKMYFEGRSLLLKQVAGNFEESNHLSNKMSNDIGLFISSSGGDTNIEKLKESCSLSIIDSEKLIESAKSMVNLAGFNELYFSLDKYYGILVDIQDCIILLEELDTESINEINALLKIGRESRKEIYPMIANAYKQITI